MADVEIGSISGSQGSFTTRKFYRGTIGAGASGDVLTITAPAGRRVRLNWLVSNDLEQDIRVIVDGASLTDMTQLGGFQAGTQGFTVRQNESTSRNICDVVGSQIIVRKISGSLSNDITYSYSEGI